MSELTVVQDKKLSADVRVDSLRKLMYANKDRLARAVAGALTPDRLISVACNSIRKNPKLLDCTPASLFSAISEAGTYGWVVDGITGQASLVPFWNGQKKTFEVVLIPGYKGLRDLVRRSGEVVTTMESVHEGDTYEYNGRFDQPKHKYSDDPERRFKPVTHAYVLGRFNAGQIVSFSWTVGECIAHRNRYSQGWRRASKDGENTDKAKDSPWHQGNPAFRVMCMKTVLLDAIHRGEFPLSVDDQRLAGRELDIAAQESATVDAADMSEIIDPPAIEQDENTVDADDVDQGDAPDDADQNASVLNGVWPQFEACKMIGEAKELHARLKTELNLSGDNLLILDNWRDDTITRIRGTRGKGSAKEKQSELDV